MADCVLKHFTDSVYYDLELTARYFKFLGNQLFEMLDLKLSPDEFSTLDTISINPEICQRDLAKLILKDRANTGRILNSLEEKGFITRHVDTKNNRLVRKMEITEAGYLVINETTMKIKDYFSRVSDKIPDEEFDRLQQSLRKLRQRMSEIVETNI